MWNQWCVLNVTSSSPFLGLFIGNWSNSEDKIWKRNLIYSPVIKLPNGTFGRVSPIVNASSIFCQEKQTLQKTSQSLVIDSKIKLQKVSYMDMFVISVKYCTCSHGSGISTLSITAEVQYSKKSNLKGKCWWLLTS